MQPETYNITNHVLSPQATPVYIAHLYPPGTNSSYSTFISPSLYSTCVSPSLYSTSIVYPPGYIAFISSNLCSIYFV